MDIYLAQCLSDCVLIPIPTGSKDPSCSLNYRAVALASSVTQKRFMNTNDILSPPRRMRIKFKRARKKHARREGIVKIISLLFHVSFACPVIAVRPEQNIRE